MNAVGVRSAVARSLRRRLDTALNKVFPSHWSYLLGEIALISFLILVASGIYLAIFYEASGELVAYDGSYQPLEGVAVPAAYHSVLDITFERPAGLLVRQLHHWSALVFVAALVAHALRVFFTGAFRRPRRLNWMIGVTLMGLATANGFFGLGLPGDLLGGTGLRIGHAFATSLPFVGAGTADLVFAGEFPAPGMYHRLWQLHVLIIPAAMGLLLAGHLLFVWLQTHTQYVDPHRAEREVHGTTARPGYVRKTLGLSALVAATLLALAALVEIAPIWLYGPFNAADVTVPAQPDWYLAWVEGALRIVPSLDIVVFGREIPGPFFTGVLFPVTFFALLYAWPSIEERVTGDREPHHAADRVRDHPRRTAVGVFAVALLGVLVAAASHDLQALMVDVPIDQVTLLYRVLAPVVPLLAATLAWKLCHDLRRAERQRDGREHERDPLAETPGPPVDANDRGAATRPPARHKEPR